MIDCHCHLTDPKFRDDLDSVIANATESGIAKIVVPSTNLKDANQVVELVSRYENIYGLVGIHPENVDQLQMNTNEHQLQIKKIIQDNPKIVGIGEIGMDCYWNRRDLETQEKVFKKQLEMAVELKLPVAIHSRLAAPEIRTVFDSMDSLPSGQFHCFGEDEEFLRYVLEKGFYVSFGGNVTFKSAENLRSLAKMVPIDRLLLETDAPYLSPEPLRGTRNEPKNVKITAEFLTELKGISFEELSRETTKNAERLYRI